MSSRLLFLLAALIASWIFAFNSGRALAFNLAYLLSGILALSYVWSWNSTRAIHINRHTRARRSQVGQYFEESFEVRNQGRLPKLWLEVRDFSTVPFHGASRVVSHLQGRSRHRWQVRTYCQQRGFYRLGPMRLLSGDPLGLFSIDQTLTQTSDLIVYPATVALAVFQPPAADLAGGEALSRRAQYLTTNVSGIREYAPGDSFNRIHWLTTARRGRLMTKEFELDPSADIWVFLDLHNGPVRSLPWKLSRPETGVFALSGRTRSGVLELAPSTLEYAVTATASVARYFLLRNRAVGMIWHGSQRYLLQTDRGERQMRKMLEALAVVSAEGRMSFDQLLVTEGVRLNRNDVILAITADPDPAWVRALREIRRRGVQSVAVVMDGSTFGGQESYQELSHELALSNIPSYKVQRGDDIGAVLGRPSNGEWTQGQ
jgi:uncharacterized protein (DUF58 family)